MADPFVATCALCSKPFRPGRVSVTEGGKVRGLYCSRACSDARPRGSADREHPTVTRDRTIYRLWALGYGRGIEATKYQRWGQRARAKCIDCGNIVGAARTRIYPAQRCSVCADTEKKRARREWRASPNGRAARQADKARRRAAERGLADGSERFDPIEVLKRDGWRCHLCGCKTPERLRGTYASNAPELDHIVPLSKGGQHTKANTACACRRCNGAKSDQIAGQPSLLAFVA